MSLRSRTIVLRVFKFALPVGILTWLITRVSDEQWEAIRTQPKSLPLLVTALLVASLAIAISYVRWALLLRAVNIAVPTVEAIRLGTIGFLLSFVSAGSVGGDVFKAFFVVRRTPGKRFAAVATILVDRALGLYGLLLVATLGLAVLSPAAASSELQQLSRGAMTLAGVGTAVLITLVLGGGWIDRLLRRCPKDRWWGAAVHHVADPIRLFHDGPGVLAVGVAMSVTVHLMLAASIYLIARGYYQQPPGLLDHLLIVPAGLLASALPLTPAGLGVFEFALEWLYEVVPAETTAVSGTLVALTFELVKIALAGLGLVFYWTSQREMERARAALARDDSQVAVDSGESREADLAGR
jgi:hypothetical protein